MEKKQTVCYTLLKRYPPKIRKSEISIFCNSLIREVFEGRKEEKYDE